MPPYSPIEVIYLGGPFDGAREFLDRTAMGLQSGQGFDQPHLTSHFLHVYRCEFWQEDIPVAYVRHVEVRKRPAVVS